MKYTFVTKWSFSRGSTHSKAVLLASDGKVISRVEGPSTNHYQLGMTECRKRIAEMTNRAKREAGIPEDTPLSALVRYDKHSSESVSIEHDCTILFKKNGISKGFFRFQIGLAIFCALDTHTAF